jgi:hypothetical protein
MKIERNWYKNQIKQLVKALSRFDKACTREDDNATDDFVHDVTELVYEAKQHLRSNRTQA